MGAVQTPQMFCRDTSAGWCVQMMGRESGREDSCVQEKTRMA